MTFSDHLISIAILIVLEALAFLACYHYGRWSIIRKFGKKKPGRGYNARVTRRP